MHIVVVGCGRVGAALATHLEASGHTLAVIDKRAEAFTRLAEGSTVRQVVGTGIDRDRLCEAGIEEAGALAAVTSGDNSNIVVARIAKETYEVPNVVARIYDPGRAALYQRVGIPTVATVAWTTDQALRRLLPDATRTEWVDPTGGIAMVERVLPPAWAGRPLTAVDEPQRWHVTVLTRAGKAFLPTPSTILQEGDVLLAAVASDSVPDFEARLDQPAGGHA